MILLRMAFVSSPPEIGGRYRETIISSLIMPQIYTLSFSNYSKSTLKDIPHIFAISGGCFCFKEHFITPSWIFCNESCRKKKLGLYLLQEAVLSGRR